MANKFLDQNGLLYFWQKIVNKFVAKVDGKGLSTNDFTNELKAKLESVENLGYGDMMKTRYDTNDNGQADKADDADKLGGQLPSYYATSESLNSKVNTSALGQANGVATLDNSGLIPSSQLPSYVDDVVEGYAKTTTSSDGVVTVEGFYKEDKFTTAIAGETGKIYVDLATNISYRWGGTTYVQITSSDMTAITNAEIDTIVAS